MPLTPHPRWVRRTHRPLLVGSLLLLAPMTVPAADWTLERSAERALSVAPEIDAARAERNRRAGLADEASRWPNPTLELGFSDELGIEDGSGGWSVKEYAIRQALPIDGRIGHRADAADKRIAAAEAEQRQRALTMEHRAALAFHRLQWAEARIEQAREQQEWTQRFAHIGDRRTRAGDLSERERLRLNLLNAEARAELDEAQRERKAALANYRGLLGIDTQASVSVPELERPPIPPTLATLRQQLDRHPLLQSAAQEVAAAQAEVKQARAERLPDLAVRVARERAYINGRDETTNHIGLQVELPLWSQGRGRVDAKQSQAIRQDAESLVTKRDLGIRLERTHARLSGVLEHIDEHRTAVLVPADDVLSQTRRGFEQGELSLTELIDAAQANIRGSRRYIDLLLEARELESDLRLATGRMLTTDYPEQDR
ncbi:TolC family protein [Guyparkeria sp. SCN-R1]|uniref:TolC family protein n=1 Tax=Guyparkeria sp. SCN-R1 TaxID=2341113 RepID=UPI000F649D21|nr:TolC family protein [Guyparkeria sp. SCN-R1]RRQ23868.1 TolC family protein [Guyparkeria sp. SCN-R1]